MRRTIALTCFIAVAAALASSGCDSVPKSDEIAMSSTADPLGALPNDLVLDVTVLPGNAVPTVAAVHFVRSKYIVFPDGSLRGDAGRSIEFLTRPAQVRTITREQLADLWLVARQAGFGDAVAANFEGNPALLKPSPPEVLSIVSVRAHGIVSVFIERTTPNGGVTDVTPAGRLIRAVARLAWASDEPPSETTTLPLRYDLGPDPYARYRPPVKPGTLAPKEP